MRVMKFLRRGFHIPPEELAKVLSRMVKKSGVSTPLITAALREVDPLYILDGEAVEEDETLVELGELNNEG